jgi:hypothetical protein
MIWRDFYLRFSHRNRRLADPYERSYVEMGIGEKGLEQCAHAESRRHAKFELGAASFISSRLGDHGRLPAYNFSNSASNRSSARPAKTRICRAGNRQRGHEEVFGV